MSDVPTTSTPSSSYEKYAPLDISSRKKIVEQGRSILALEAEAIREAQVRLGESFADAVHMVLACKGRVCVTGVGKAGLIGNKIQATLASTGTPAYSLHPVEALHGDLGMVRGEDVVIALSKSGSSELVELMPRLKATGCSLILLTANLESKAACVADVVLDIGDTDEACPLRLAPSSSTASMLAIGDALALTVMELRNVRPEQYASFHPGGALGRLLTTCEELMRSGSDCPRVGDEACCGDCWQAILGAPRRAGAAVIVDKSGKLVGILTQGDFFRLFGESGWSLETPVREVMTKGPKSIVQTRRVMEAVELMRDHAIDELPVVDNQSRLVGMIDIQDLISKGYSVFDTR